ncbi:hypothetical protein SAMN04489727_9247 [Amycolatopsis tolypomycina]|uniref:Uncharacterized protein n=1 Tax=Amycolatopsis tolypomycina TaxID=208445 RepID=A0A1H5DA03_9PSEU|nr:hypothetical protein [Amycolatopsis tolypomycina]SED75715.1 hypothetical protein SAMN04489727_9247 [Amycolatopsis tolypomycina]
MTQAVPPTGGGPFGELTSMGIEPETLAEAIGAGSLERKKARIGHCAKNAPGFYAWNGTLTSLSQNMPNDADWKRLDPSNLPVLISAEHKIVFTVSSGDALTGQRVYGQFPTTKNPKGRLTNCLQRRNANIGIDDLFDNSLDRIESPAERRLMDFLKSTEDFKYWILLVFTDAKRNEIRYEVSEPRNSDANGRPAGWSRRLICPPYPIEEQFGDEDPNEGFGGAYDVSI